MASEKTLGHMATSKPLGHTFDRAVHSETESLVSDPSRDPEWRAAERRLVRKLDMTLLPMAWVLYMFNYLDRNGIAQAHMDNIDKDLGLVGKQFNFAVSILNVGYLLAQLPSNMILTRVRPSIYLPCCVVLWSVVSAAAAAARNYGELVAVRFFLGIAEAPFFPGVFFLMSCWYTRRELALRTAILYSALVLATAFSGLVAAGVFAGLSDYKGLHGWQWLFIIEGIGGLVAGLVGFLLLPDYVDSTTGSGKWLFTDMEREVAAERISRDRVSVPDSDRSVWNGLKLAVYDYRTWMFAVLLFANHSAYGFNNFFPSILKGFKLGDRTTTMALTAPPYLIGTAVSIAVSWSSDRFSERGYHISVPMAVAATGFGISVATLNVPARYFASFLYTSGCFSANSMVHSWFATVLNQTPEKRACAVAIINMLSQLGNVASPYFFPKEDEPRYVMAMCLMMGFSVLSICTAGSIKFVLKKANKELLRKGNSAGERPVLYPL